MEKLLEITSVNMSWIFEVRVSRINRAKKFSAKIGVYFFIFVIKYAPNSICQDFT